jgi:hypothetical protein
VVPFLAGQSDGKNAHVTVSADKAQIHKEKAVDKVKDLGQQGENKVEMATQKARD